MLLLIATFIILLSLKRFNCKDTIFLGNGKGNISFFELYYTLTSTSTPLKGTKQQIRGPFPDLTVGLVVYFYQSARKC